MRSNTRRTDSSISLYSLTEKKFFLLTVSCVLLLIILVYANSLQNDFTNWDDRGLVVEDPAIRSLSFANLLEMFTPRPGKTYQPVRVLSYAIDYHFWQLNPVGYHLGNTILHGLSAILLYLLLTAVLNQIRGEDEVGSNRMISFITAVLFTVHPVNVEAVAWIASRKYGLLSVFYFLSFFLFVKDSEEGKYRPMYYILSIITYVFALLSSPFSVTLPAMLYLYDYCRKPEINFLSVLKKRFLYYIPYVLLSISQSVIIMQVVSVGRGAAVKGHYHNNPFATLAVMLSAFYGYMKNLLLPLWLNNWYVENVSFTLSSYKIAISVITILALIAFVLVRLRSGEKLATKIADRYLYLPAVGLFLWFSLILYSLTNTLFPKKGKTLITFTIVAFLVSSLSYLSMQRNKVWANTITLWSDSIDKQANNRTAHLNLGQALSEQGRLNEAMIHFREALRLSPNYAEAHNNLGSALAQQGKLELAIPHFYTSLKILPDFAEAHNNLAVALARQGRLEEAAKHYSEAARLYPDSAEVHNNLAVALVSLGRVDEAIPHYVRAVELKPDYAEAYNNLGNALDQAIAYYSEALEIKPKYAKAHNNLGVAWARLGELDQAIARFNKALQLQPDYTQARNNLAIALQDQARIVEQLDSNSKP
jgi:Flp pilus assembly protein TadD